jgi:hypothetical protein
MKQIGDLKIKKEEKEIAVNADLLLKSTFIDNKDTN